MCGCTLYDSPTCGHSWLSMSQPCGFLSDLLSCPQRQTYQTLIAPPMSCPMCNGGFADQETIQMVQGPWGCNQMLRNQVGGSYAIPGSWGNAGFAPNTWANQALIPSHSSQAMVPYNSYSHPRSYGYDHRLTGPAPFAPRMAITNTAFNDGIMDYGCGYDCEYDCGYGKRRGTHTSSSKYKYRRTTKPAGDCMVM